jgi:hypothetical protein
VKPASFDYHSPASIDEALAILARHRDEARLLAGGQSLVPMLNFRLAAPPVIVDLNRIPNLAGIQVADGVVRIGAMVRQRQIEFAPLVEETLPLLRDAMRWSYGIGSRFVESDDASALDRHCRVPVMIEAPLQPPRRGSDGGRGIAFRNRERAEKVRL